MAGSHDEAHHIDTQAASQHVTSRRPRRATALAATLRIQGKLERAGIVYDRKSYMESLSSAVTLAQTQDPQQARPRDQKARQGEHEAPDKTEDLVTSAKQGTCAACPGGFMSEPPGVDEACEIQRTKLVAEPALRADAETIPTRHPVPAHSHRTRQCRKTTNVKAPLPDTLKKSCHSASKPSRRPRTLANAPPKAGAKLIPARINQARPVTPLHPVDSNVPTSEGADWNAAEVKQLLHVCSHRVRPDTTNFWIKVAKNMPGRTVCQCFEKYYEAQKTPPRPKRSAPASAPVAKPDPPVMKNGICLTTAKKKKVTRHLRWELQAAQGSAVSDFQEKMKRQKRIDAFIDSYKRKRHKIGPHVNATKPSAQSCSEWSSAGPTATQHMGPAESYPGIGTSSQAIAALKKVYDTTERERLRDTPERDEYCGESSESQSE